MYKLILSQLKSSGSINFQIENIERNFKGFPDIKRIENATVNGSYTYQNNALITKLSISSEIVMLCSHTLNDVIVNLNQNLDFIFSKNEDSDYPLTEEIELEEIVIGNIIAEAPYNVYTE